MTLLTRHAVKEARIRKMSRFWRNVRDFAARDWDSVNELTNAVGMLLYDSIVATERDEYYAELDRKTARFMHAMNAVVM